MLKIIVLLSLTTLLLTGCQGNRLNGSTSSSVATAAFGFVAFRGQR